MNTRVLVVDDDETARRLNLKVLKKLGFDHLNEAEDGAKALDIIRHELDPPVGLVLSDWQMPDIHGLDFLNELRKDPSTQKIPFLMITAILDDDKLSDLQDPFIGVLAKPYRPYDLVDALNGLYNQVEGKGPQSENVKEGA